MKAGVYIVKDLFSEQKYILSLNGKEPFIRITNSISLSSFANGLIERDHKIVEQILEDPTKFEFTLLSKEIESSKIEERNTESSSIQYTDEQYKVAEYTIEYLKRPSKVTLVGTPTDEYTDLPTHTHMEIVKMAVQLILGTLPNYNVYSNEVNTME